jgi:glycosyltransferase involved in cell wall biosynthesis
MKICHITYTFPPTKGGSETHNYTIVKYLLEKGYDVDVILIRKKDANDAENVVNKGIKVHHIFPKLFPFWIFQVRKEMRKIEKEGKVDVFDIHSIRHASPFIFQKKKIVYSLHFFELNCPGPRVIPYPRPCIYSFKKCWRCCGIGRYFEWLLLRWFAIRKTTKFMVKYDYLKKIMMETGIEGEKIVVVPHWIDVETINKKAKTDKYFVNNINPSDYVFVFFGRLAKEKGPDILLEAFALLTKEAQNAKLVFIADGPLRRDLEETCDIYNIKDKVIFGGMIPHENLFEYISLADTIVFPHRYFNYEWALLEAMCTEKPIIATDMPATADILINDYNALLVEPTPESLALKMKEILENPELGEKIAKNALKTVREKHRMENLEKYEELVKEMVE